MKRLLIIANLVVIPFMGFGQEPPRKANLVVFESDSLANFNLFKECVNILKSEGFSFEQIDKDFYVCSTKPVRPERTDIEYRFDLTVTDNKIEIRSHVRSVNHFSGEPDGGWQRGAYRSLPTSIWRFGWDKQTHLADKLMNIVSGNTKYLVD